MSKKPLRIFQERSLFNNVRRSSLLRSTMLLTTMLPTLLYANEGVEALSTVSMKAEMAVSSSSDVKIKGNVKDETGEPLIGVSVTVQGATIGTVTDYDGNFELSVPANSQLVFSYIGYTSQTVKVSGNKALNITLKEDSKALDEVVVVGFGSQKKVNVTGAITQVSADQLKERPVQNVSQALQGVVPGLNLSVNSAGGELNGAMNINIRGGGTIGDGSNSSPLVLIDGVEGNMNSINPQDIESISVLKDAASAAVYGSRAPFGVILITTKKGSSGRTTINYNNNFRFSSPIGLPNMLDSYRFAQYFNRASQNAGGQPIFNDKMMGLIQDFQNGTAEGTGTILQDNNYWGNYSYGYANTDWFDVHYKDHSFSQEHNLSVNGGSEKVQYLVSGNFMNSNGILTYSDDTFDRYS
ncbi:MAG: SusC/RagA family TonB-linked outer membrane protein, partial [Bacteroidales bacterium]